MKYNPNKQFVRSRFLVSVLCVLCASVVNLPAQDWKSLKDGIEYAEVTKEISGLKVNMNLLRLDLTKVRLDVNHAMDAAIGTEKTSSIATRHGAFAAINAGFFRLDNSIWAGDPAGALKIDGTILSESANDRISLLIDNAPTPCSVCAPLESQTWVSFEHLKTWNLVIAGKQTFSVGGINRERRETDLVLYYPEFGISTLTQNGGVEVVVSKGKIKEINTELGSSKIPTDGFVISGTGKEYMDILKSLKIGRGIIFRSDFQVDEPTTDAKGTYRSFRPAEDVVAGVPQLIKNGKIDITWEQEKTTKSFVETRHPRTAVAKLKDGKFLMITVDGRTESSGGIGLQDLAEYLLSLGAVDAMNLDGGGSTTMFVDGKVVNHPSDKEGERKVSDAILVTPRKKK
jgi:exopolysaccharide biosynthesis protein